MENNETEFIWFEAVENVLDKNGFFGITAKRKNSHVFYTYVSYRHGKIKIIVETVKSNPTVIPSPKMVACITINGKIMQDYNMFLEEMKTLTKYKPKTKYKKKKYQTE
jgi:predicted RNA binding protein YcfA (HicA-like mRNA interferase family)